MFLQPPVQILCYSKKVNTQSDGPGMSRAGHFSLATIYVTDPQNVIS